MRELMKILATNKNAYHDYEILETLEAGLALTGSEVKSIREGRISLKESYADFSRGELYLLTAISVPITPLMSLIMSRCGQENFFCTKWS